MFLIASIPVSPDSLYGTVGVLCLLLTVAVQVITIIRARQPQPFLVKADDEYVKATSYHKHCEINRDEHARIEGELDAETKELRRDLSTLAREVSVIAANESTTSARLTQIDGKIDRLIRLANPDKSK